MTEQVIDTAVTGDAETTTIETTTETTASAAAADTGAAAQADAGETGTIATNPDDKPVAAPADWPSDWREKLAGTDEKLLSTLKRYASPANWAKAGFEAQQKIRTGEYKKPLDASATPEQVAEWRKENGIPEKASEYAFDLGGFVPSENDKPILENFKEFAHARNMTPAQLNDVAKWYFEQQEAVLANQIQADKSYKSEQEEELRREYGAEFKPNINAAVSFLTETAGQELTNLFLGARLADGSLLGNNANALRWLVNIAREQSPGATLLPAGTPNIGKGLEDRISEIENVMRTDESAYFKNEKMQAEYRDLLSARDKLRSRAA